MNWLDFIASLVRSILSWPVAFVIVAWLLRKELAGLLGRLESLQHKDTVARFTAAVEKVRDEVADRFESDTRRQVKKMDEAHARPTSLDISTEALRLGNTLADYPEAAVLASWSMLETAMRNTALQRELPVQSSASVPLLVDALVDAGVITEEDQASIAALRRLRNEVAHTPRLVPLPRAAISYAETVGKLMARFQ